MRIVWLLLLVFALAGCSGNKNKHRADPVEPKPAGPTSEELFVKGNKQLDSGAWAKAIESYDEALEKDPKNWEAHMNRGIALSRLARFGDALSAFDNAIKNGGGENATLYYNLGNLYQDRGMYSEAVDAYRMSLALEPKPNVDTLLNLGAAYIFLRQYDFATETYEYVKTLAPDDPRPVHGVGLALQMNERYADAVAMYEQAHSLDPQFPLAYFNKARCLAAMKEYPQAIASIQRYLNVDPDGPYRKRAETMLRVYKSRIENGDNVR